MTTMKIVPIDTTEYWRDDIKEKAGRIIEMLAFNPEIATHIASLQPSFFLLHVNFVTENEVDDETYGNIQENMDYDGDYFSSWVLRAPGKVYDDVELDEDDDPLAPETFLDWARGNAADYELEVLACLETPLKEPEQ